MPVSADATSELRQALKRRFMIVEGCSVGFCSADPTKTYEKNHEVEFASVPPSQRQSTSESLRLSRRTSFAEEKEVPPSQRQSTSESLRLSRRASFAEEKEGVGSERFRTRRHALQGIAGPTFLSRKLRPSVSTDSALSIDDEPEVPAEREVLKRENENLNFHVATLPKLPEECEKQLRWKLDDQQRQLDLFCIGLEKLRQEKNVELTASHVVQSAVTKALLHQEENVGLKGKLKVALLENDRLTAELSKSRAENKQLSDELQQVSSRQNSNVYRELVSAESTSCQSGLVETPESYLRKALTRHDTTLEQLKKAIDGVDALLDEAKRELAAKSLREKRAAFEELHGAIEAAEEIRLTQALERARQANVEEEDICKAEAKLTELREMTDDQRRQRQQQVLIAARKKECFLLVKKDDAERLHTLLAAMETDGLEWKDWKDHAGRSPARFAQDMRATRVLQKLRERVAASPQRLASETKCDAETPRINSSPPEIVVETPPPRMFPITKAVLGDQKPCGDVHVPQAPPSPPARLSLTAPLAPRVGNDNGLVPPEGASGCTAAWIADAVKLQDVAKLCHSHEVDRSQLATSASAEALTGRSTCHALSSSGSLPSSDESSPECASSSASVPSTADADVRQTVDATDSAPKPTHSPVETLRETPEIGECLPEVAEVQQETLPQEEMDKLKLQAFRSVVKDDTETLTEVLSRISVSIWRHWENKANKNLLTLSEERGSSGAYAVLAKALGLVQEQKREAFEDRESVWIYLPGEVQPRRATVCEDVPAEADEVLIQYWDGDDPVQHVERCMVRKMWS